MTKRRRGDKFNGLIKYNDESMQRFTALCKCAETFAALGRGMVIYIWYSDVGEMVAHSLILARSL